MKKWIVFFIVFLPALILFAACSDDKVEPEPTIPLDGRGGGVIAYCSYTINGEVHEIYGINADGKGNKKLIESQTGMNNIDWSPDAAKIVCTGYLTHSTWSIHTFNADGTILTRLTTTDNVQDDEPAYSPSGSEIVFTRIYPDQNNRGELWIMNSDGSNQRYINIEGFAADWSPDGTKLVYHSNKSGNYEIYTCDINGTNEVKLTNTNNFERYPVWSPDGQYIYFSSSDAQDTANSHEIFRIRADGTDFLQLTNNSSFDSYPHISSDGLLIAFETNRAGNNQFEIYIMNIDGSNARRVTNNSTGIIAINPAWRPQR